MAYNQQTDSDGTDDDDLPPQQQPQLNRALSSVRKGRPSGNGRPPPSSSSGYIDQQIRQLELDAYTAVLRAFSAQSEAITWGKERLMSDMRKELRVADEQHREILGKVGEDDTLKRIRMYRQTGGEEPLMMLTGGHDPSPSPAVSNSRKKQKTGHAAQTFPPPPPPPLLKPAPHTNTLPSPAGGGPPGSRGKKSRSKGGIAVGAPSVVVPARGAPPGSSSVIPGVTPGRGSIGAGVGIGVGAGRGSSAAPWSNNHKGAGPSSDTRLPEDYVGRKIVTRWPDDNTFYEAVIAEYNKESTLHCLAYDRGTKNETFEWVDLKAMDKTDYKWIDGPPVALEGKVPPPPSVGRGVGRGTKRGRGPTGGPVGRPKGSTQRGRPAMSLDKLAAPAAASPRQPTWRGGGGGPLPADVDRNGTDKKGLRSKEIHIPDFTAFVKESEKLEHEDNLEKLESVLRQAKEYEETLKIALVQVGESSDDAASDDGRNHGGIDSPVHLARSHHSLQDTGDHHHADSEDEYTGGDNRREDGSDGIHAGVGRDGAASDAEAHNSDDDGEGDDDR